MEFVQLTGGRPAQLISHVRYVVKFSSARNNAQRSLEMLSRAGSPVPQLLESLGLGYGCFGSEPGPLDLEMTSRASPASWLLEVAWGRSPPAPTPWPLPAPFPDRFPTSLTTPPPPCIILLQQFVSTRKGAGRTLGK